MDEVIWLKRSLNMRSAPGPNGVTPADLRAAENVDIIRFYNILLRQLTSTSKLAMERTTLIPKKDDPQDPSDFQPITITSIVTRVFYKIMARRLGAALPSSNRQKGFKEEDGVGSNLLLIRELIQRAKQGPRNLYLGFVDFKKAFDSVCHPALLDALRIAGFDDSSLRYLETFYSKISTTVEGTSYNIARGVMQGDPLSPLLFNLALDYALLGLNRGNGVELEGEVVNYLAIADDIVVVARDGPELQNHLDTLLDRAGRLGLEPGVHKCATLGVMVAKRRRTWLWTTVHLVMIIPTSLSCTLITSISI